MQLIRFSSKIKILTCSHVQPALGTLQTSKDKVLIYCDLVREVETNNTPTPKN